MADAGRFLLVRLDGLGDALACVPMLAGLRRAHPAARFGVICSPENANVFSSLMDSVHVMQPGVTLAHIAAELRPLSYTHAIVATEEVVGYNIARVSGARRRAGFWHRLEKPFKSLWQYAQLTDRVYRPAAWRNRPEHEVVTLYRLAQVFGATLPPPDNAEDLRGWLAIEAPRAAVPNEKRLGFQISRKLAVDGWGPANLAAFCGAALGASGQDLCELLVAPNDEGLAGSLLEQMSYALRQRTVLAPPGSVPQWFGAISALAALITPDTGAAHAAGMLGVPVIDLFMEARFEQLSQQWRPWAAPHRCLVKPPALPGVPENFGAIAGREVASLLARDPRA